MKAASKTPPNILPPPEKINCCGLAENSCQCNAASRNLYPSIKPNTALIKISENVGGSPMVMVTLLAWKMPSSFFLLSSFTSTKAATKNASATNKPNVKNGRETCIPKVWFSQSETVAKDLSMVIDSVVDNC